MSRTIDELKQLNHRLTSLLSDEQPGISSWHLSLGEVLNEMAQFAPDKVLSTPLKVEAECHSDDRVVEVSFDASLWFCNATNEEIQDLVACNFRGDYASDNVAIYMAQFNEDIEDMFKYIETVGRVKSMGFECSVNSDQAIQWIKAYRPHLMEYVATVLEN